jgi:hypothetical protein
MSLKIRFKFDGRCRLHLRYNPETDGPAPHKDCPGCESLWVIFLYSRIARKKAENGEGMLVSRIDVGNTAPPEGEVSSADSDSTVTQTPS